MPSIHYNFRDLENQYFPKLQKDKEGFILNYSTFQFFVQREQVKQEELEKENPFIIKKSKL